MMKLLMLCSAVLLMGCSTSTFDRYAYYVDASDELPQGQYESFNSKVRSVAAVASGNIGTAWWLGNSTGWVSVHHVFAEHPESVRAGSSLEIFLQGTPWITEMIVGDCGEFILSEMRWMMPVRSRNEKSKIARMSLEDWIIFQTPHANTPDTPFLYDPTLELRPGETVFLVGRPIYEIPKITPEIMAVLPLLVLKSKVHDKQPETPGSLWLQLPEKRAVPGGMSGGPAIVFREGVAIVVGIFSYTRITPRKSIPVVIRAEF